MATERERAEQRLRYIEAAVFIKNNLDAYLRAVDAASDESAVSAIADLIGTDPITAQSIRWMQLDQLTTRQQDRLKAEHAELVEFINNN